MPEFELPPGKPDTLVSPGTLIGVGPLRVAGGGVVSNTGLSLHQLGVPALPWELANQLLEMGAAIVVLKLGERRAYVGQVTPMHFHWSKTEDIINRAGGKPVIQLYNATPEGELAESSVSVSVDAAEHTLPPGQPDPAGLGYRRDGHPYHGFEPCSAKSRQVDWWRATTDWWSRRGAGWSQGSSGLVRWGSSLA